MIPKTKSVPNSDPKDKTVLIYGNTGVGKSTLVSQIPGNLLIPTEPGLSEISCFRMPQDKYPSTYDDIREVIQEIYTTEEDFPFRLITLDTVDNLYDLIRDSVCQKNGIAHPTDMAFKGWDIISNEFLRCIKFMASSSLTGLWMTSHSKEKKVDVDGIETTRIMPAISDRILDKLTAFVSAIGYLYMETDEDGSSVCPVLYFGSHRKIVTKNRLSFPSKIYLRPGFDYEKLYSYLQPKDVIWDGVKK